MGGIIKMHIQYSHLLDGEGRYLEGIIKLLIERIAFGDAPFLSRIKKDVLHIGSNELDLRAAKMTDLTLFLRKNFNLYKPLTEWKDIRKHSIRNMLLCKYIHQTTSEPAVELLRLHLALSSKCIINEDVQMDLENFKISSINGL
jgi:hypothetical protein